MQLNRIPEDFYEIYCGDNREQGSIWVDKCDRISLGYLPETHPFILRALEFARKHHPVMFHYHYLHEKEEADQICSLHFNDAVLEYRKQYPEHNVAFTIQHIYAVKSYAPKIIHSVADVQIFITLKNTT